MVLKTWVEALLGHAEILRSRKNSPGQPIVGPYACTGWPQGEIGMAHSPNVSQPEMPC